MDFAKAGIHTQKHIKNHPVPKEEYLYHSDNSCGCVFVACDGCVDINLLAYIKHLWPSSGHGCRITVVSYMVEAWGLFQCIPLLLYWDIAISEVWSSWLSLLSYSWVVLTSGTPLATTKGRQCHQGTCFHAKTLDERHLSKSFPCEWLNPRFPIPISFQSNEIIILFAGNLPVTVIFEYEYSHGLWYSQFINKIQRSPKKCFTLKYIFSYFQLFPYSQVTAAAGISTCVI